MKFAADKGYKWIVIFGKPEVYYNLPKDEVEDYNN